MSSANALHSDHVNLLVFRYLQEVGFENAAHAFQRDWHRPAGCHDPEDLPFAHEVQRNELVSVIQTGLHHDDLQARVKKGTRRFRWTRIEARESVERRDALGENGASSRPPSSSKHKGRPPTMRAPNEFPTPAPKRLRRSEGSEAHINGEHDAMEIDMASHSGDVDEDADGASPTIQSETEQVEVMERYDSMDVATQTDVKTSPKTSTMYWKLDKPGASVWHSIWNPDSDTKSTKALLTVGESLCRFYEIPDTMDDVRQITHVDDQSLPEGSTVTASAWRPDGVGACCAITSMRTLPDESSVESLQILEVNREGGTESLQLGPPLLEPVGLVLHLRYSPAQHYLLAVRVNNTRSLVQIWKSPRTELERSGSPHEPIAWRMFESRVLDVAWIADDTFVVCGDNGLSAMYQVDPSQQSDVGTITAGTVTMRGLISRNSNILDSTFIWDKLRYDQRHRLSVFASVEDRKLLITPRSASSAASIEDDVSIEMPEALQALAFRPGQGLQDDIDTAGGYGSPSMLAAAFYDGICIIYSIGRSEAGVKCTEAASLSLLDGPALALAWSPNGEHLALGNAELVQIWTADSLRRKNGALPTAQACVIWRPASEANGVVNGEHEDSQAPLSEPSLSWSSDGETLAFAADKQIAVMRFRPSLNSEAQETEMNGRPSP